MLDRTFDLSVFPYSIFERKELKPVFFETTLSLNSQMLLLGLWKHNLLILFCMQNLHTIIVKPDFETYMYFQKRWCTLFLSKWTSPNKGVVLGTPFWRTFWRPFFDKGMALHLPSFLCVENVGRTVIHTYTIAFAYCVLLSFNSTSPQVSLLLIREKRIRLRSPKIDNVLA